MEPTVHPALEYHAPSAAQLAKISHVRLALSQAVYALEDNVPGSAERTLAIRKLEEASMWANKAIVFDGERYL